MQPAGFTPADLSEAHRDMLPSLTYEEYRALKADIAERGVMVPLEVAETGAVIDGHHRLQAWRELQAEGVAVDDPPMVIRVGLSNTDQRMHRLALNLQRRHLSAAQREEIVASELLHSPGNADKMIARATGLNSAYVAKVRRMLEETGEIAPMSTRRRSNGSIVSIGAAPDAPTAPVAADTSMRRLVRHALIGAEVVGSSARSDRWLAKDIGVRAAAVRKERRMLEDAGLTERHAERLAVDLKAVPAHPRRQVRTLSHAATVAYEVGCRRDEAPPGSALALAATGLCLMRPACFDPKFGRQLLAGLDVVVDVYGPAVVSQVTLPRVRTLLSKVADAVGEDAAVVVTSALLLGAATSGVAVSLPAARHLRSSC